jgi:hypothetical protein
MGVSYEPLGQKNKAVRPSNTGHQNIRKNKYGTYTLSIGAISYGNFTEITQELIEFRDKCRAKQGLKPADY